MSGRPYLTPSHLATLRADLRGSDWQVLGDVRLMRLAVATDLQRLASLRGPVQVRSFRRQLQRLHERGVLFRLERSVGGARAGSAGYVYGLGIAGQRLLSAEVGGSARRPWTPRPSWLQHALAASHLYVMLREAEAAGVVKLVTYESEPEAWRVFGGALGLVTLKPDAFVRLETTDSVASVFVEVDCGTESPATIGRKADVYGQYWQAGEEQAQHGVFPEVLWLGPTEARCRVLTAVLAARLNDGHLHRVARYEEALTAFIEPP